MVIVTVLFISTLATVNEVSRERIAENLKLNNYKSILYAFDILPANIEEHDLGPASTTENIPYAESFITDRIESEIRELRLPVTAAQKDLLSGSFLSVSDSITIYTRTDSTGGIVSYGFPMRGKGLWGTISAFGVISADLQRMIGIDFTEQVETPGLGARITESEFKYFFRNLDLSGFFKSGRELAPVIMIKQKNRSNVEESTNELQAITGATQTVDGVLKMVNTDLRFYIALIQSNENAINKVKS
jgi:Na+-transporting NADH:ubiquinone oxidoreductase subunit C